MLKTACIYGIIKHINTKFGILQGEEHGYGLVDGYYGICNSCFDSFIVSYLTVTLYLSLL